MNQILRERESRLTEDLRRDQEVTGLWSKLVLRGAEFVRIIVYQMRGSVAEQITLTQEGQESRIKGKITFERKYTGHPTRVTLFTSEDGTVNTELSSREF